jgi:hypothetical protein
MWSGSPCWGATFASGVAALVVFAFAAPARGETRAARVESYGWERRFAISLHVGLRSPLGAGVAYEVSPVTALALEGGVGQGDEGFQVALGARLRLRARSVALSAGAGLSAGPFAVENHDCQVLLTLGCSAVGSTERWRWSRAVWRNIDLSIERRSTFGFHWRFYVGVGTILNPEDAVCTPIWRGSQPPCSETDFSSPYIGTSFGYAF